MEHPPRTTHSSHFEVDIECDEENENIPVGGLYGPGRTIGKFLDVAGRRIDSLVLKRAPEIDQPVHHEIPSQSIASERARESLPPDTFETTFVCDSGGDHERIKYHCRAGKTLNKALDVVGHRLDKYLSRTAERAGYGPRVASERIRRNFKLLDHYFHHYHDTWWCKCEWATRNRSQLAAAINAATGELRTDVKRLLKHARSNVILTKKQAMEYVLHLSLDSPELHLILQQMDAIRIITDQERFHSSVRHGDGFYDNLLLSSSRKALISLTDVEVTTVLKKWNLLPSQSGLTIEDRISVWHRFTPFLYDRNVAFLVLRGLRRSEQSWNWNSKIVHEIIRSLASAMPALNDDFEWNEFEAILGEIYQSVPYLWSDSRSIVMDFLLLFARNLPGVLQTRPFRRLSATCDELDFSDFREQQVLKAALITIFDEGQQHALHSEIPKCLKPYRVLLDCPIERALANCASVDSSFSRIGHWDCAAETILYYEVARCLDSDNLDVQAKAWKYAYYFLARGLVECDLMLKAISRTSFASATDFISFKRKQREQHVPREWFEWRKVYRHLDERTGRIILTTSYSPNSLRTEVLSYAIDWVTEERTEQGSVIQTQGLYPLLAGYDANRTCSYIAKLNIPWFKCSICHYRVSSPYAAVVNGTKPEDLRVEVSCPHEKRVFIPESIDMLYLSYSHDEYPENFCGGYDGVDATGPFSWLPAERCCKIFKPYTCRIMTATEALEIGILQSSNRDSNNDP